MRMITSSRSAPESSLFCRTAVISASQPSVTGGLCSSIWYRCRTLPRSATMRSTSARTSGKLGSAYCSRAMRHLAKEAQHSRGVMRRRSDPGGRDDVRRHGENHASIRLHEAPAFGPRRGEQLLELRVVDEVRQRPALDVDVDPGIDR